MQTENDIYNLIAATCQSHEHTMMSKSVNVCKPHPIHPKPYVANAKLPLLRLPPVTESIYRAKLRIQQKKKKYLDYN